MWDLFGNHIVGFLTRQLFCKLKMKALIGSAVDLSLFFTCKNRFSHDAAYIKFCRMYLLSRRCNSMNLNGHFMLKLDLF